MMKAEHRGEKLLKKKLKTKSILLHHSYGTVRCLYTPAPLLSLNYSFCFLFSLVLHCHLLQLCLLGEKFYHQASPLESPINIYTSSNSYEPLLNAIYKDQEAPELPPTPVYILLGQ